MDSFAMAQSYVKRIAVLTGRVDVPGMNAAIRPVIQRGAFRGVETFKIRDGCAGLIAGDFQPLRANRWLNGG